MVSSVSDVLDLDNPSCVCDIAEAILEAQDLNPVFIESEKLNPYSEEYLKERAVLLYDKISHTLINENKTKNYLTECLSLVLENQPPNPYNQFNQRYVKILKLFLLWENEEDLVEEFIHIAFKELENAGLTGIIEIWETHEKYLNSTSRDYLNQNHYHHRVYKNLDTQQARRNGWMYNKPDRVVEEYPTLVELEQELFKQYKIQWMELGYDSN
jgi:hypothetical protein